MIEVFKLWVRYRYEENKEWKDPKLGDAQGTPRKYSRKTQVPKLGDAPEGIPSFVFNIIGNLIWSYVFIHHVICILLGASIYFVRIWLLLFITMFCIFYSNKFQFMCVSPKRCVHQGWLWLTKKQRLISYKTLQAKHISCGE